MKKTYEATSMEVENEVKVVNDMLLGSDDVDNPNPGEQGGGEDFAKERGTYGNLWD